MNHYNLFKALKKEFNEETALNVVIANSINIGYVPTEKDFVTEGRYTKKLDKKIRMVLWETENIQEILAIQRTIHEWGLCVSMDGYSGCTKKSFTQLLEDKANDAI